MLVRVGAPTINAQRPYIEQKRDAPPNSGATSVNLDS